MRYTYKQLGCYFEKNKSLFIVVTGEFLPYGGEIETGPVFQIELPTNRTVLADIIQKAFSECWKMTQNGAPKQSAIGSFLGIKSYCTITKRFSFFILRQEKETGYELQVWRKAPRMRGYELEETRGFGNEMDYDSVLHLIQDDDELKMNNQD